MTTSDANDNVSKNSAEQKVDNIVTKDITSDMTTSDGNDNTSDDATDKAIDEAINKLVASDVNKDTNNKKVLEKNSTNKDNEPLIHIVKKDQNLFYISRTYNIRLSALRRWNHLTKNSVLQVGDVIYLSDPATIKTRNKVQTPND